MKLNGKGYITAKTNSRNRLLPFSKDCLEDNTKALLCEDKWEIEMNKPDAFDLTVNDIEIE